METKKNEWMIFARDTNTENFWRSALEAMDAQVGSFLGEDLILVDSKKVGWKNLYSHFDRKKICIILVLSEHEALPSSEDLSGVDDLLVFPFRLPDLLSRQKAKSILFAQLQAQSEIQLAQQSLEESSSVLERILKEKTPKPYSEIKGLNVMSRYLSGLKPGGDYLDIFESERKDFVNILLSDSSSYGVSSALLGMILSSSAKIANDFNQRAEDWISAIFKELETILGDKEHLSLFFGRLNRRNYAFHYQLYGSIEAYVIEKDGAVHPLEKHGQSMCRTQQPTGAAEKIIRLDPKDRIILLSDGFVKGIGGEFSLQKIFHQKIDQDPFSLVSELTYQIKSKLVEGETFPGEDCSAIVIDVEHQGLRLAPTG